MPRFLGTFSTFKKIAPGALLVAILALPVFFLKPDKTEALLFGGCPPNVPNIPFTGLVVPVKDQVTESNTNTSANATRNVSLKECWLDGLVKQFAKAVIHDLTSSIINWINNGFEGGPTFVTDPAGFFSNIADEEFGRMINGSSLGFLCDPFKLQIQLGFAFQLNRTKRPTSCTLSKIAGNVTAFTNGDFSQGGWDQWFNMTTNQQNNPYGSAIMAQDSLNVKIAGRQGTELDKLNWGNGFHSIMKDGKIVTPGTFIDSQLKQAGQDDLAELQLGKEFDDILAALGNLAINSLMSSGVSGGHTTPTPSSNASIVFAECYADPLTVRVGQTVTWKAIAYGGNGSFRYSWSGTDGLAGTAANITRIYTSSASTTQTASVRVTSGSQSASSLTCLVNVTP